MRKGLHAAIWFGLIVITGMGCQTVKDVEITGYLQDKPRLDQNRDVGNAGYLMGAPSEKEEFKETRKVYVIEFTKPADNIDEILLETDMTMKSGSGSSSGYIEETTIERTVDGGEFPDKDFFKGEDLHVKEQQAVLVDYVVEKDDTLQKISKKFYDSYSKWPRIYDLNREKIKNPDRIQPGITISIPVDK